MVKKTNAGMASASGVYITCNANAPTIKIDNPKLDAPAKAGTINNTEPKISNTPIVIRNHPGKPKTVNACTIDSCPMTFAEPAPKNANAKIIVTPQVT